MTRKNLVINRNTGIDILRGLAILSVILLHLNTRVPFSDTFVGQSLPKAIYKILFWSGYYEVCIFFVISGFLITTSSLNKWGQIAFVADRSKRYYSFHWYSNGVDLDAKTTGKWQAIQRSFFQDF